MFHRITDNIHICGDTMNKIVKYQGLKLFFIGFFIGFFGQFQYTFVPYIAGTAFIHHLEF